MKLKLKDSFRFTTIRVLKMLLGLNSKMGKTILNISNENVTFTLLSFDFRFYGICTKGIKYQ